jgi:hypothetical protein
MEFVLGLNVSPLTGLTTEEMEQQLVFCSQVRGTFLQLKSELEIYHSRLQREYDVHTGILYIRVKEDLLAAQLQLVAEGKITKSSISITRDDIQNRFYEKHGDDHKMWMNFIDQVQSAKSLVANVAADLESRSMILMSLRKKHQE